MAAFLLVALSVMTWVGLRGDFGPATVVVATIVGAVTWSRTGRGAAADHWLSRLGALLRVAGLFASQLIVANLQQALLVLSPRLEVSTRWIHYPTELESPALRTTLVLMVSLTPGTLAADIVADQLVVHVLMAAEADIEEAGRQIRRLEQPLKRLES